MANKERKAQDQIIFSLAQDIKAYLEGNPYGNAASTAAIMQADIAKDGQDQDDYRNLVKNQVLDQNQQIPQKIISVLQENEDIVNDLLDTFGEKQLEAVLLRLNTPEGISAFGQMLQNYLQDVREYASGGQFEKGLKEIDITVGGKDFDVIVFSTEKQKSRGLMNVTEMDSDEGGLFVYDEPQHVDY